MRTKGVIGFIFSGIVGGVVSVLLFISVNRSDKQSSLVEMKEKTEQKSNDFQFAKYTPAVSTPQGVTDFRVAAKKSVNAVVHVTTKTVKKYRGGHDYQDLFEQLFGQRGYNNRQRAPKADIKSGSGVIISSDGYIVTNNHVIANGDEVNIVLNDKTSYVAKVVGTDEVTDIALLKIDAEKLPFLDMGDSDALEIGEWVLAVGNPLSLSTTVTAGIVSAKSRSLGMSRRGRMSIESFIQTDAAVNSGNSGGALVNTSGQLVGINTAIFSRTGSYVGYSFAVPTTIVRKVISDIREYGKVQRAILGITIADINAELKEQFDLKVLKGVYISDVIHEGGADDAGIKKNDVIIKINDSNVESSAQLQEQISQYRPGDVIDVTVDRFGKQKVFKVTLKNKHGSTELVSDDVEDLFGAEFKDIAEKDKKRYRIYSGIQVKTLLKGKFRSAGIKEGFILTTLNGKDVNSVKDFQKIVNNTDDDNKMRIEGSYPNGKYIYVYTLNK